MAIAKREASETFGRMVESKEGRQNLFKIAKRIVKNNKENIGGRSLKNDDRKIISGEERVPQVAYKTKSRPCHPYFYIKK